MQRTGICLWFDGQAAGAARFYTGLFDHSATGRQAEYTEGSPGETGTVMTVPFSLEGLECLGLNGGPMFHFNPAGSLMVTCETEAEVDALYARLNIGKVLLPLQRYPFSEKYAWIEDKYGLSWQIYMGKGRQKVAPFLMFTGEQSGKAEEAMRLYT